MKTNIPELLAPAGTMEQLEAAILYGADAVYLGGGELSLRAGRAFKGAYLEKAVALCRKNGIKVYFCLNAYVRQRNWNDVQSQLEHLAIVQPHAIIIADAGVFSMARSICKHIPIHLSTQANTCNAASAKFWHEQGATRVNLARELTCTQIYQIKNELNKSCPSLELECFVHGALCLAISGQCLLSAWLNDRPANEGLCTQPCRYKYRAMDAPSIIHEQSYEDYSTKSIVVEESMRADAPMWEISQDQFNKQNCNDNQVNANKNSCNWAEQGDYSTIWSPDDICLIRFVPWYLRNGINSLKIEGRMRTGGYVAQAVDMYRHALTMVQNHSFDMANYIREIGSSASRPLGTGFFIPRRLCDKVSSKTMLTGSLQQDYEQKTLPILARVEEQLSPESWIISVRHRWNSNNDVEILMPGLNRPRMAVNTYAFEKMNKQKVSEVHSGTNVILHCNGHKLLKGVYIRDC